MHTWIGRRIAWEKTLDASVSALAVVAALVLFSGACERDSRPAGPIEAADPTPLSIAPASLMLTSTQTVAVLTARGGTGPYAWRVSDTRLGSVPGTDAATVTYTRMAAAGAQVVRVTDRNRWAAECVIRQE